MTNPVKELARRNTLLLKDGFLALASRFFAALALMIFISACAIAPKDVWQKFTFDGTKDGWASTVDLLEYAYGDRDQMTSDNVLSPRGLVYRNGAGLNPRSNINGPMPVGTFLHVKWRLRQTNQVYEERIDLRDRLPANMKDHGLTFVIDGAQLHVYVITPQPKADDTANTRTWYSKSYHTYEIFPQLKKP